MVMWAGRFKKELNKEVNDFNSSINVDGRMYFNDIKGSMAHAMMLGTKNIISKDDADKIIDGLQSILDDLENNKLQLDLSCEDIHMFVEAELTKRIGDLGKKLHTARSRNDQVALDTRMYLKQEINELKEFLLKLIKVLIEKADSNKETVMPGYTHLQRAQPISYAQYLLAYVNMFKRDLERFDDTYKRMNLSPLGSAAFAGTTYDIDRFQVANELGFSGVCENSIDAVSDRDFVIELASTIALTMMHLSRFSEEIILFCSWEFKFIELDDAYTTGSSIMPQKKNPDIAELVRGKTGRTYGNLISLLTMMKGLPLAYNKDTQEDKEAIFDSVDTLKLCLNVFTQMIETLTVNKENMYNAAKKGFINATDVADYLTKKGLPFRDSYKIVGNMVRDLIDSNKSFEELSITEFKKYSILFENDIYEAIDLFNCMEKRLSYGGTSIKSVTEQIKKIKGDLDV